MFEHLKNLDTFLFFLINGAHTPFMDQVFYYASNKLVWIPLYVFFIYRISKTYPGKIWLLFIFIALMILVTDQAANLFKNGVARYRPTHEPAIMNLVHTVMGYRGGLYGFFSGHAANSAAVATLVIILNRSERAILILSVIYVFITCYSRMYLGVHYPSDILAGVTAGIITGFLTATGFRYTIKKWKKTQGM